MRLRMKRKYRRKEQVFKCVSLFRWHTRVATVPEAALGGAEAGMRERRPEGSRPRLWPRQTRRVELYQDHIRGPFRFSHGQEGKSMESGVSSCCPLRLRVVMCNQGKTGQGPSQEPPDTTIDCSLSWTSWPPTLVPKTLLRANAFIP